MEKLLINGKDAYDTWGVRLADGALLELLKPPPMKAVLENKSAVQDGKQILVADDAPAALDERDLNIPILVFAEHQDDLVSKVFDLQQELGKGELNIVLEIDTNTEGTVRGRTFRGTFIYKQCTQLQSFLNKKAKLMLQLNQPNPADFFVDSRDWESNFITADMQPILTADRLIFNVTE